MDNDAHSSERRSAEPSPPACPLNYANFGVIMVANPLAVGGLICAMLALGVFVFRWSPVHTWEIDRILFRIGPSTVGVFGFLSVVLGAAGIWLARDPTTIVAGRRIGLAALLLGCLCLALLVLWQGPEMVQALRRFRASRRGPTAPLCQRSLRQIGQSLSNYVAAHGYTPLRLKDLGGVRSQCPDDIDGWGRYAPSPFVYVGQDLRREQLTAQTVLVYEPTTSHSADINPGRHILFGDGRVEWFTESEAARVIGPLSPPDKIRRGSGRD